jgi:uridine phosphorylase
LTSRNSTNRQLPPILDHKQYDAPSVFLPENLLREARRQKAIAAGQVPPVCILDPDGDIATYLTSTGQSDPHPLWACYHTRMFEFTWEGANYGIVPYAVGASFAVLVAEELFASGCKLLISMTSAGQIVSIGQPPYFILIEQALRDEGTSYHYLPPSRYARINPALLSSLEPITRQETLTIARGATWTTDAPFRETEAAIEYCRTQNILAVEMEASALYAFAQAQNQSVVCFAHVTNQMGSVDGDFEKGVAQGSLDALEVITRTARVYSAATEQSAGEKK